MIIRPGVFISDRYEIIDKVGSGGMADVYKAKCHRLNRFVAMKILKAEFSDDKKFVEKFRAEAQSAAGLSHPNVVNVYDVGEENGMYYIVMELVEGITLKSFIERKGKLEVKEAVGIAVQIAQGMEAAHGNHIVHRDIKPQNIIISKEGKVKVTDFGIAKAVTSDTITSNAMGSVHYLSPEQARGGFSDEKSDIYSLGVTLYEMLTGRVPFIGDNTVSVALSHLQDDPIPLRDLEPGIPVSLDRIVQKCMQKKPEYRYLTASDLIADLKKSLSNPDGAYIQILSNRVMEDSPTISFSDDDMRKIKSAAHTTADREEYYEESVTPRRENNRTVMKEEYEDEDEEDEDEDVNPTLEKLMSVGGVIAAIIIVFIIIFIIVKASGIFGGGKPDPEETPVVSTIPTLEPTIGPTIEVQNKVPNVTNLRLSDVQSQLERLGLKVVVTEEESDSLDAGYIIRQDLEAETPITEGMTINLVVSKGKKVVPAIPNVPNVVGYTANDALTTLQQAGYLVAQESEYSDSVAEGKVIRTSPSSGSSAEKGTKVTIYVSKGKEDTDVQVPDLRGCTQAQARKKLENNGLVLSDTIAYEYDDNVPKDQVISQSYTVGASVAKGTVVSVTISLGKQKTYRYVGSITISDNPFVTEDQTGNIKLTLKQDGKTKTIYEASHGLGDFPLVIPNIEGYSKSTGQVYMYLDGAFAGGPYNITFKQVEE
ncbi:MAG: Stk1 family PASTA domain-containing Ser/Thr kinase [Lachnospiraceae bacterium]|nr:Stk1 family PASTA domain-containing Ser/Thr kinase [Lachnospiraceae bacterium]